MARPTHPLATWPSDDLRAIGVAALIRHDTDMELAESYVFRACRDDPELLSDLLLPWWRKAADSLLVAVRRDLIGRQRNSEFTEDERRAAGVANRMAAENRQRLEREDQETAELQAKYDAEYKDYLEGWHATKARDFKINDQPFWEVSVSAARQWQRREAHHVRFVELLIAGLPEDSRPIKHYRRPNEVDALWEQAFT